MIYGVIGAQRTGKTTLAAEVAESAGGLFLPTDVKGIHERMGVDVKADLPFAERLTVQEHVLEELSTWMINTINQHSGQCESIFFDRTPLDVYAYTMSEVLRSTVDEEIGARLDEHRRKAFVYTNFIFNGLCLVRPGIPVVEAAGKAPGNSHYQRHVDALMLAAVYDPLNDVDTLILADDMIERKSRVSEVSEHFSSILDEAVKQRQSAQTESPN